ncbi:MAG: tetratricopeptide repeat protein [Pseudomonadota bacterium]|nr:tetratricopeptide repeat protein [Pseudomonadota bacterium]
MATQASAFDPAKVFEGEKPSLKKVFKFFFTARKKGDKEEAVGALRYAAEQGSHAAQWKLGRMYQTGDGVEKNPAEAFEFFKQVADAYAEARPGTPDWQFTANAMVALGRYYRDGIPDAGIASDRLEAQVMFTTAATYFGHPDAQFELARMYLEGENERVEVVQAARMLKSAAAAGHAGAEALLGHLIYEGEYLRRDPVRGLAMMLNAQKRAGAADREWIEPLQEEAFALASEDERRAAISSIKLRNASQ